MMIVSQKQVWKEILVFLRKSLYKKTWFRFYKIYIVYVYSPLFLWSKYLRSLTSILLTTESRSFCGVLYTKKTSYSLRAGGLFFYLGMELSLLFNHLNLCTMDPKNEKKTKNEQEKKLVSGEQNLFFSVSEVVKIKKRKRKFRGWYFASCL